MSLTSLIAILYSHFKNSFRRLIGDTPIPYKWLIQLTNDCNSRCAICDIWKINKDNPALRKLETSIEEYEEIFKNSGKDLKWLALSGGEVSLYSQFEKFSALIKKHCPHLKVITFTSNGLNPSKVLSIAQSLRTLAKDIFIVISLDGDEELHDKLRGVQGNFNRAHETFELLKEAQFKVYFGATLNNLNASWLSETKDIKAISLVHSDGIYSKTNDIKNEELVEALRVIIKNYRVRSFSEFGEYLYLRLGILFLASNRSKLPVTCESLSSSIHISPYGEMKPCMYLDSIGNLKNNSLYEVLASKKSQEVREKIQKELCPKCWMNCYAPHSIIGHPLQTLKSLIRSIS